MKRVLLMGIAVSAIVLGGLMTDSAQAGGAYYKYGRRTHANPYVGLYTGPRRDGVRVAGVHRPAIGYATGSPSGLYFVRPGFGIRIGW